MLQYCCCCYCCYKGKRLGKKRKYFVPFHSSSSSSFFLALTILKSISKKNVIVILLFDVVNLKKRKMRTQRNRTISLMLVYICNLSILWPTDNKSREEMTRWSYWLFIHEDKFNERINNRGKKRGKERERESWLSRSRKTSRLMRACL